MIFFCCRNDIHETGNHNLFFPNGQHIVPSTFVKQYCKGFLGGRGDSAPRMSDREVTRWQHNHIYPQPAHNQKTLSVAHSVRKMY